jgi:hypothetical protein
MLTSPLASLIYEELLNGSMVVKNISIYHPVPVPPVPFPPPLLLPLLPLSGWQAVAQVVFSHHCLVEIRYFSVSMPNQHIIC